MFELPMPALSLSAGHRAFSDPWSPAFSVTHVNLITADSFSSQAVTVTKIF
jgi:hypothetical protein